MLFTFGFCLACRPSRQVCGLDLNVSVSRPIKALALVSSWTDWQTPWSRNHARWPRSLRPHARVIFCTYFNLINYYQELGYWHQRADERHGNPPQGNQELLVVRDKVGRPPGELGVSKSMKWDIFPSVLWHCWLGDRNGSRPVKKLDVGLLVMMIWLELCTNYSSSCHHHLHHPLLQ